MVKVISITDATVDWATQRQVTHHYHPETASTNSDAKSSALSESDDFVLYLTAHQTAGRGRGANTWLDTGNGENLLSTWSFRVDAAPQPIIAPRIGLALFSAASSVWPSLEWSLKAPNDLFLAGRKVGGLLVETVTNGSDSRLLIGLGLNVLNHPRRLTDADHMGQALQNSIDSGEWFQFLDQLQAELLNIAKEANRAQLNSEECRQLVEALNANSQRPFPIQQVSAQGDLIHAKGRVSWKDL